MFLLLLIGYLRRQLLADMLMILILKFHKVDRNIAINSMGSANATNFKPTDRFRRKAKTIVEMVIPIFDIVVVVDRVALGVNTDRVAKGFTSGFVAITNQGDDI